MKTFTDSLLVLSIAGNIVVIFLYGSVSLDYGRAARKLRDTESRLVSDIGALEQRITNTQSGAAQLYLQNKKRIEALEKVVEVR